MSERWLGVSGTDVDAVELLTSDISDTNLNSTGRSGADRRGLQRSRDAVSPKVLLSRSSSDCWASWRDSGDGSAVTPLSVPRGGCPLLLLYAGFSSPLPLIVSSPSSATTTDRSLKYGRWRRLIHCCRSSDGMLLSSLRRCAADGGDRKFLFHRLEVFDFFVLLAELWQQHAHAHTHTYTHQR